MTVIRDEAGRLRNLQRFYTAPRRASVDSSGSSMRVEVESNGTAMPDSALTAFLQLVALRLSKQRALISLVDEDHQFFIAEGTRTGNLVDPTLFEDDEDAQWMGCTGSTTRAISLCTHTIASVRSFVVPDLRESRFSSLPYVVGAPYFRYYFGVPLISSLGHRVGSLFVIDTRPGRMPSDTELAFMTSIAESAMNHLELQADQRQSERTMVMSRALSTLVEPITLRPSAAPNDKPQNRSSSVKKEALSAASKSEQDPPAQHVAGDEKVPQVYAAPENGLGALSQLFSRAADLLRQALSVDYATFIGTNQDDQTRMSESQPAELLAASSSHSSVSVPSFDLQADKAMFEAACDFFPTGKLWCFKPDGSLLYEEEMTLYSKDTIVTVANESKGYFMSQADVASVLHARHPRARQILFIPFHTDGALHYNTVCFAMKYDDAPLLSTEHEISFMRSFVNSLTVLYDRLKIKESAAQKTQFISSISHELRSPLHGIVATTELLSDTRMTSTQKALCETLEVCTQSLLEMIIQILDFNKINDFLGKNEQQSSSDGVLSQRHAATHRGSSLHSTSTCDVGVLCEEVLTISTISLAQTLANSAKEALVYSDMNDTNTGVRRQLDVDLRIAHHDWRFVCSPGAIRRIIMNLVDNSFKYTQSGMVRVSLDLAPPSAEVPETEKQLERVLLLRVTDTGMGTSPEYLEKGLFVPFSQASSISKGSGLGWSLVRGIVESLHGKIDVQSSLGKGTEVLISIPLKRPPHWDSQEEYPLQEFGIDEGYFNDLSPERDNTFCLHGSGSSIKAVKTSLRQYMQNWLGFEEVAPPAVASITVVSADDPTLTAWLANADTKQSQTPFALIVLRSTVSANPIHSADYPVAELTLPVGPIKLAKVVRKLVKELTTSRRDSTEHRHASIISAQDFQGTHEATELHTGFVKSRSGAIRRTTRQSKAEAADLIKRSRQSNAPQPTANGEDAPPRSMSTEDEATKGTTASASLGTGSSALTKRETTGGELFQPKVLCVDDNEINLKLLVTYSKKVGFKHIDQAEHGQQAFDMFKQCKGGHDIIFMDLTMPICDGFQSTAMIRGYEVEQRQAAGYSSSGGLGGRQHSTVIAFTGLASTADQGRAFAAGVDHFITKPLRFKDFKILLETCGYLDAQGAIIDSRG